jgi:hypothetical protein
MPQKESDYIPRMHLEVLDNLRKDDYVKSFSEVGLVEMIIVQVDRMDFIEPVHSDPYSGAVGNADPRLREQPAHYQRIYAVAKVQNSHIVTKVLREIANCASQLMKSVLVNVQIVLL